MSTGDGKGKGGDKQIQLTVVVMGTGTQVDTNLNAPLKSVAEKALTQTAQPDKDLSHWEMTTEAGAPLSFDSKVGDAGLKDKETILLNRRTGITG